MATNTVQQSVGDGGVVTRAIAQQRPWAPEGLMVTGPGGFALDGAPIGEDAAVTLCLGRMTRYLLEETEHLASVVVARELGESYEAIPTPTDGLPITGFVAEPNPADAPDRTAPSLVQVLEASCVDAFERALLPV